MRQQWAEDVEEPARRSNLPPPRLEVIHSPYRKLLDPLMQYIDRLEREHPDRLVTAVVPEVVKRRWWQFLMHNYRAERLRSSLLKRGDSRLVVVTVPWYLGDGAEAPAAGATAEPKPTGNGDGTADVQQSAEEVLN